MKVLRGRSGVGAVDPADGGKEARGPYSFSVLVIGGVGCPQESWQYLRVPSSTLLPSTTGDITGDYNALASIYLNVLFKHLIATHKCTLITREIVFHLLRSLNSLYFLFQSDLQQYIVQRTAFYALSC